MTFPPIEQYETETQYVSRLRDVGFSLQDAAAHARKVCIRAAIQNAESWQQLQEPLLRMLEDR